MLRSERLFRGPRTPKNPLSENVLSDPLRGAQSSREPMKYAR